MFQAQLSELAEESQAAAAASNVTIEWAGVRHVARHEKVKAALLKVSSLTPARYTSSQEGWLDVTNLTIACPTLIEHNKAGFLRLGHHLWSCMLRL